MYHPPADGMELYTRATTNGWNEYKNDGMIMVITIIMIHTVLLCSLLLLADRHLRIVYRTRWFQLCGGWRVECGGWSGPFYDRLHFYCLISSLLLLLLQQQHCRVVMNQ
jgi:hypothetical protein